jgi:Arc/MetJ family transcription regulator
VSAARTTSRSARCAVQKKSSRSARRSLSGRQHRRHRRRHLQRIRQHIDAKPQQRQRQHGVQPRRHLRRLECHAHAEQQQGHRQQLQPGQRYRRGHRCRVQRGPGHAEQHEGHRQLPLQLLVRAALLNRTDDGSGSGMQRRPLPNAAPSNVAPTVYGRVEQIDGGLSSLSTNVYWRRATQLQSSCSRPQDRARVGSCSGSCRQLGAPGLLRTTGETRPVARRLVPTIFLNVQGAASPYISAPRAYILSGVAKHLVDIDEDALDDARRELGTRSIKDTINLALRRAGAGRTDDVKRALDVLARAELAPREQAWH